MLDELLREEELNDAEIEIDEDEAEAVERWMRITQRNAMNGIWWKVEM